MRPTDCQNCYRAAERNGDLVHQLKKTAQRLHNALNHRAIGIHACLEPACLENWAVINGRVLEYKSTKERSA